MKDWFKETGSPMLYPLRFEGTGLTDLPRLYLLDSPGFSRDGFGRTGSFLLNPVGFGGTGLVDFPLSCPTRLGLGWIGMGFEGTGLGFRGTGLVDSSLSCPTRLGIGMGFEATGLGFGGTGLVDSPLSCPTRLGFGQVGMRFEATGLGFRGPGLACLDPLGRWRGLADRPFLEWREEAELPERFCFAVAGCSSPSDTEPIFSRPLDREEVLLSFDSELSVLWEFSLTVLRVVFCMDQRLDLRRMGEEARVRPSLSGVGVRGQSFRQSAGMFSADIEISLK